MILTLENSKISDKWREKVYLKFWIKRVNENLGILLKPWAFNYVIIIIFSESSSSGSKERKIEKENNSPALSLEALFYLVAFSLLDFDV